MEVARARLSDPSAGLSDEALDATDVLIWWGHLRHDEVPDDRAAAVAKRVREGWLGLVVLHSSCASKPFRKLMKTSCEPGGWRQPICAPPTPRPRQPDLPPLILGS